MTSLSQLARAAAGVVSSVTSLGQLVRAAAGVVSSVTSLSQLACAAAGVVSSVTSLNPVLNWANVCSPEHTSDTSTNYDSFLN